MRVCVCVCMRERERERGMMVCEREREREGGGSKGMGQDTRNGVREGVWTGREVAGEGLGGGGWGRVK